MIGSHPLEFCLILIQRVNQLLIFTLQIFKIHFSLIFLLLEHVLLVIEQLIFGLHFGQGLDYVDFVVFLRLDCQELRVFLGDQLLLGVELSIYSCFFIFDCLYHDVLLRGSSSMFVLLLHQLLLGGMLIAPQLLHVLLQ